MMRKIPSTIVLLALGPALASSARPTYAFVGPYPAIRASQLASKAEDHLQEIAESWTELQQKEKAIEQNPNEVRSFACGLNVASLVTNSHPRHPL